MPYQNFPYTNFQNLNLDWILKKVKEMESVADEAQELVDSVNERFTNYDNALSDINGDLVDIDNDIANINDNINNIREVPIINYSNEGYFLKAGYVDPSTDEGSAEWSQVREVPDTTGVSNGEVLTKTANGYEWTSALGSGGTEVYYYVIDTGNTSSGTGHLTRTGGTTATLQHMLESFGIGEIIPIIRFTTNVMSNENTPVFIPLEISTARAIFGAYDSANSNFRIMTVPYGNNATVTLQTIAIGGGSANAVLYTAQSLTDSQKTQARINIGASTETIRETVSGTSASIDAEINTMYLCGTMAALTIDTFPPTGIFSVVFTSGSTATTLTVPNTLHMPDGFTVEANKRYEINVLDGYACAQGWTVSA